MAKKKRLIKRKPRRFVHACECLTCRRYPQGRVAREHRALNRLIAASDERTRRLLAGFLARQPWTDISQGTISFQGNADEQQNAKKPPDSRVAA